MCRRIRVWPASFASSVVLGSARVSPPARLPAEGTGQSMDGSAGPMVLPGAGLVHNVACDVSRGQAKYDRSAASLAAT